MNPYSCSDEFKRHKTAKPAFVELFMVEWQGYLAAINAAPVGGDVGRTLSEAEVANLSEEQREQLGHLHTAAKAQYK